MTGSQTQPRRRKRLLSNLLLIVVLLALAVLLLVMLASHRPEFYEQSLRRGPERLVQDAYDFSRKAQDFVSAVWSEKAFPLELTEDEVNGYLAAANDDRLWRQLPLKFESWRKIFTSTTLRQVRVSFRDGRVTVAGQVTWRGSDLVLSLVGVPRIDSEGRARLEVSAVRAGALPVPRFFLRDLLKSIQNRPLPARSGRWRLVSVEVKDGKATLLGEPKPRPESSHD